MYGKLWTFNNKNGKVIYIQCFYRHFIKTIYKLHTAKF